MAIFGMSDEELRRRLDSIRFPKLPYRSVKKDYNIKKNVNSKICAECGGDCCKMCGCHFSPDDFEEISFDYLKKELEKGYISIDYVDGEVILEGFGVYILRIRNVDSPIVSTTYFRRRQPCILLTDNGCKLEYDKRPTGGKLLVPSNVKKKRILSFGSERTCQQKYTISDCCYEWKPHQRIISNLIEYFKDKDFPCSI